MALELKDILEYLGVDATVEDLEAFKETFDSTFLNRDKVHLDDEAVGKIWARKAGELEGAIKAFAESFNLELPDPTFKTIKHKATFLKLAEAIKANTDEEKKALEAQNKGGDPAIKDEYEKKLKALEKKYNDANTLLGNVTGEYEKYKEGHIQEKKGSLVKGHFEESKGKVKWVKDADPLKMKGLMAEFNDLYELQTDEENKEVYPVLRSSGQRVKSSKKASEFAATSELLELLADQNKMLDKLPEQKKLNTPEKKNMFTPESNNEEGNKYGRQIHPSALED